MTLLLRFYDKVHDYSRILSHTNTCYGVTTSGNGRQSLMNIHKTSFATIVVLNNNLAEITVDNGVDIDLTMVDEILNCLLSIFSHNFSLLINKKNSYSTQLDALIYFNAFSAIDNMAVFAPNKFAKLSADFSATLPSSASLNIEVFTEREAALAWLTEENMSYSDAVM